MTGERRYVAADRARMVPERPKSSRRGDFERDRARVLHSAALRRLGGKTQVMGPGADDFARTRLTHSLEVAQVGRELAAALGCDPDVVDTACLAHDLGHPPFGHNGEAALAELTRDIGGFEGNAQTLRLLTRIEPKVHDASNGRSAGLNLTRASLDAATKYPWRHGESPHPTSKFGVYPDDEAVFTWLREGAPPGHRCIEAQVMDLADDIAYSVHDVEDAVVGGWLDLAVLSDADVLRRIVDVVDAWYLPGVEPAEVEEALDRLTSTRSWVTGYDGTHRGMAALKNLTSQLIGRFCQAAEEATRVRYGTDRLTRYAADVVVPRGTSVEMATLKAVAAVFVMTLDDRQVLYSEQRAVLTSLVVDLVRRGGTDLEPLFAADWAACRDDGARLRVAVDQVATLTDASAYAWARRPGAG